MHFSSLLSQRLGKYLLLVLVFVISVIAFVFLSSRNEIVRATDYTTVSPVYFVGWDPNSKATMLFLNCDNGCKQYAVPKQLVGSNSIIGRADWYKPYSLTGSFVTTDPINNYSTQRMVSYMDGKAITQYKGVRNGFGDGINWMMFEACTAGCVEYRLNVTEAYKYPELNSIIVGDMVMISANVQVWGIGPAQYNNINLVDNIKFSIPPITQVNSIFKGDGSLISADYSDYLYFETCIPETTNCSVYLVNKLDVNQYNILNTPLVGLEYVLRGQASLAGTSNNRPVFVFDIFTIARVYTTFDGIMYGTSNYPNVTFYKFKACNYEISSCHVYLLDIPSAPLFPALDDIEVGDQIILTGGGLPQGAAAGTAYFLMVYDLEFSR